MNKYDEYYSFRPAVYEDTDAIMKFIRENWNENHILGNDREFFLYEHSGKNGGINFYLMIEKKTNEIVGVVGHTVLSEDNPKMISNTLTKVKSGLKTPMCGVELLKRQKEWLKPELYGASGVNAVTIQPIFDKVFHYITGVMPQYYKLNRTIKTFQLAEIREMPPEPIYTGKQCNLASISSMRELEMCFSFESDLDERNPKDRDYIEKRFFDHPIYTYYFYGIQMDEHRHCGGVFITRVLQHEGARCLRIVDYLGAIENIPLAGRALDDIMKSQGYEFIDFPVEGLSNSILEEAGFIRLDPDGENVIPTYFEPFEKRNIKIIYEKDRENGVIFKANGDQDRPSIWRGAER